MPHASSGTRALARVAGARAIRGLTNLSIRPPTNIERLVLGSDILCGRDNLSRGIGRIRSLDINEGDKELMLGENTARLLQIIAG